MSLCKNFSLTHERTHFLLDGARARSWMPNSAPYGCAVLKLAYPRLLKTSRPVSPSVVSRFAVDPLPRSFRLHVRQSNP